jgi:DnaJ-class molecular chaperone
MGLTVTLADLYTGGERVTEVQRRVVCRGCKGKKGKSKEKCKSCGRCPNETRMVQRQMGPGFMVQQVRQ